MKKYQVLARAFRPQTFKEVVGQESVVTILKNAMHDNRVAHAYLFSGIRGIGKTTLARVLAKALNCQNPTEDLEPCNHCSSCQEISECRSLDVIEIDGASNRGIDDIRKINETVFYAPTSGKYKIYIIDEVHMLTKEAFNALLKTLESPPEKVKFFFATTEVHKVLPTILSRTQRLELKSISLEQIAAHLQMIAEKQERKVSEKALLLIAKHAGGSLRDSLSLFDQILCYTTDLIDEQIVEKVFGLIPSDFFAKLDTAIQQNNPTVVFSLVDDLLSSGKDLINFIDQLIEHMRQSLNNTISGAPSSYTEPQLLYIIEKLIDGQILLQKSPSKQAIVEMLLLQIIETGPLVSLPQLARRLLLLEKELKQNPNHPSDSKLQPPEKVINQPTETLTTQPAEQNTLSTPIDDYPTTPMIQELLQSESENKDLLSQEDPSILPVPPVDQIEVEQIQALSSLPPPPEPTQAEPAQLEPTQLEPTQLDPTKLDLAQIPSSQTSRLEDKTAIPQDFSQKSEITKPQEKTLQNHPSHYDNLMRFSEVELEGIIHKN